MELHFISGFLDVSAKLHPRIKRRCPDYMLKSAAGEVLGTWDLKTKSSELGLKTTVKSWFFNRHFKAAMKYDNYQGAVVFYRKAGAQTGSFKLLTKAAMVEYGKQLARKVKK